MKITIIGAGIIGSTLAKRWTESGHEILFAARDPNSEKYDELRSTNTVLSIPDGAAQSDVIVLAIPGAGIPELLDGNGSTVDGWLIVDASNDTSTRAFHHIADFEQRVPDAKVYRAFDTLGWENFADPTFGNDRADLFYSGPASDAATVEQLVSDVGLRPIHVGEGVSGADLLDGLTRLWFTMAFQRGHGRKLAFRTLGLSGTEY